jgi:hypothetical protein
MHTTKDAQALECRKLANGHGVSYIRATNTLAVGPECWILLGLISLALLEALSCIFDCHWIGTLE